MEPVTTEQTAAPPTVLQRKARAGRDEHQSRAVSLAKALRLAVGRVADKELNLAMAVLGFRREVVQGEGLGERLSGDDLILLLEGPFGQKAAALFDPALAGALIQQQTMGQVKPQADTARKMTATDAALVAPFLDQVLGMASPMIEVAEDQPVLAGFRFGAQVPDLRLLLMALEGPEYHLMQLSIDVAGGQRQGELRLVLPVREVEERFEPTEAGAPPVSHAADTLEPMVMSLEADLRIALTRVSCSVSRLNALRAGAALDLGSPAFDAVTVQTRSGTKLAKGALGQVDGVRAVQLHHRPKTPDHPRRRQGDVPLAGLDPHLTVASAEPEEVIPETGDADLPELADMPELADLEGFSELPDLPELVDPD